MVGCHKKLTSLPFLRYWDFFSYYHILCVCAIPTYRIYRLYNYYRKALVDDGDHNGLFSVDLS